MNFLAHAFLSGTDENIIVGNFITDHVKGKVADKYADEIKTGINLHRRIDAFTDMHPMVKQGAARLKDRFGKYSGVIIDMYYDHFLAKNWTNYSEIPIREFTASIYAVMQKHFDVLPPKTRRILPYMMADDWLAGYAHLDGLHLALSGMSRRTKFNSGMEYAVEALIKNYDLFLDEFRDFFPELQQESSLFLLENGHGSQK